VGHNTGIFFIGQVLPSVVAHFILHPYYVTSSVLLVDIKIRKTQLELKSLVELDNHSHSRNGSQYANGLACLSTHAYVRHLTDLAWDAIILSDNHLVTALADPESDSNLHIRSRRFREVSCIHTGGPHGRWKVDELCPVLLLVML
jgi:hypothetical protein